jgi:hypothetical protein
MTIVIAINILIAALVFTAILSLEHWAVRTAHRDRLHGAAPRARRERRVTPRPVPAHLERRGAYEVAGAR